MKFPATKEQIFAAQQLFIAMAYREMVSQEFEKIQNELLQSGSYHYDDEYYSDEWKNNGLSCPPDKIIRRTTDINMMSGLLIRQLPGYENTDCAKFYKELAKKATAAGFKYAGKALDFAVNDVARYEDELIKSTLHIHKIELRQLIDPKDRANLLDILTGLFSHVVEDESFEENQRIFYNERMTEKVRMETNYSDNEQSFRIFRSLKKFIPVMEFVTNTIKDPDTLELYEGIEGILLYEPFAYIFQMKEGETWEYRDFITTSCRYAFINGDEIFESNDLEPVERELFKDFIKSYLK